MNSINMPLVLLGAFLVLLVIIRPSRGRYGRRNGWITLVVLVQSLFFLAGLALVLLGLNYASDLLDLLPDSI